MWLNARNDSTWVGFHLPTTTELLARDLLITDVTHQLAAKNAVQEVNQASQAPATLPTEGLNITGVGLAPNHGWDCCYDD